MASAKEIKSRIKSVKDTRKITNAMYLIASTKLRRAKADLEQSLPYFTALREEIKRIFRTLKEVESEYFYPVNMDEFEEGTYGVLAITADKGLAGSYNSDVIKEALRLRDASDEDTILYVIGEYGRHYFERNHIETADFYYSGQDPTMDLARQITEELLEDYQTGRIKKLFVVYTDSENNPEGDALSTRLLPFHRGYFDDDKRKAERPVEGDFIFSPSIKEVLDKVIESYISGFIYGALISSFSSEQTSRMNAMHNANENADEILADLSLEYNRVRQAAITQEITEISAGAKAQKNK